MRVKELEDGEYQTFSKWLGSEIKKKLNQYLTTAYTVIRENICLITFGLSLFMLAVSGGVYLISPQAELVPWICISGGVVAFCVGSYTIKSLKESYNKDIEARAQKARYVTQSRQNDEEVKRLTKLLAQLAGQSRQANHQAKYHSNYTMKSQIAATKHKLMVARLKAQQRRDREKYGLLP